jgi:hypothetical protein
MKALTLTQPYATLVANGWKGYETRSWRTDYRGPLAIHAASGFQGVGGRLAFDRIMLDLHPGLVARLEDNYGLGPAKSIELPLGAIIAVTWIEEIEPTDETGPWLLQLDDELETKHGLPSWEYDVGDYSSGRWAWRLREPCMFTPIPAKGARGLWTVPDEVIPEFARRVVATPGPG